MSNTIVMNTLTGAVTEYDWTFQSITPGHAGDATGLYALGGSTDAGRPIVATVTTGTKHWGGTLKKFIAGVYFAMRGTGTGKLTVHCPTEDVSFSYLFPVRSSGESRAVTGRGIRENYLAFTFQNPDGDDFALDRIEVLSSPSTTRRI